MGAKKQAVPPFHGYYDPRRFDRTLLPHDSAIEVPVRAPHRAWMVPKCNIVPPLVKMCCEAGVTVSEDDFLTFRLQRPILSRFNPRFGIRRVRSGQLYVMYEQIRLGLMPPLFVQILGAAGWHQRPDAVVVHRPLPRKPRKKGSVPDPAQYSLTFA